MIKRFSKEWGTVIIGLILIVAAYNSFDFIQNRTFWCGPEIKNKALCGGILQARASLFSGFAALIAGWLLYLSATVDMRHRHAEKIQKKEAYKQVLQITLDVLEKKLGVNNHLFENAQSDPIYFPKVSLLLYRALSGKEWENHAMFSSRLIRAIYELRAMIADYKKYTANIRLSYEQGEMPEILPYTEAFEYTSTVSKKISRQITLCKDLLSKED